MCIWCCCKTKTQDCDLYEKVDAISLNKSNVETHSIKSRDCDIPEYASPDELENFDREYQHDTEWHLFKSINTTDDGFLLEDLLRTYQSRLELLRDEADKKSSNQSISKSRNSLQWSIPKEELTDVSKVTGGRNCNIFKAKWNNSKDVALKVSHGSNIKNIFSEINIMRKLSHKNIVQIYGYCDEFSMCPQVIVMEYLRYGDLYSFIRTHKLDHLQKLSISGQIAEGMAYLESQHVVHRDLAARNIFLGDDLTAKVGDYELSRDLDLMNDSSTYVMQGLYPLPIKWMAPESLALDISSGSKSIFTLKSDIWSFGIVLVELYTNGRIPYPKYNNEQTVKLIRNGKVMKKPSEMPEFVYKIAKDCWAFKPDDRPTFADVRERFDECLRKIFIAE